MTKKAPETALSLFPSNGLAQEAQAATVFKSAVADSIGPNDAATLAKGRAFAAYRDEPLTPEAHAMLARVQDDQAASSSLIQLASQMDRREVMLQVLVLQESVEASNYAGVVQSLDRILRVRPSRSSEMFKVLLPVFVQEGTVEEFAKILNGSSAWHNRFINFALSHPPSLINLYRLRSIRPFENERDDKRLIEMLAKAGELQLAQRLYHELAAKEKQPVGITRLSWSAVYPPFDWSFADEADLRAQPALNSAELEVYVRPGQGGIVAKRIQLMPSVPFSLSLRHRILPRGAHEDMQLVLQCAESNIPLAEERFAEGDASITVESLPTECEFLEIQILGRAWTGKSALRGGISPIELRLRD
ncbi:hypothetical protein [Qipengyuania aquimaris]|uniref:Uncharacterized protein n=1 Tax=Qipengyuania aquimaris TaxID=255984 RepID=A0A9Q3S142_9SPHN|nr:hypothetical protein [Qipengyuania aquimaris]MBY6217875.1 hypothetical protein [Qipengyuania aquimaris]